jgi:hypothetical protein
MVRIIAHTVVPRHGYWMDGRRPPGYFFLAMMPPRPPLTIEKLSDNLGQ